MTEDDLYISIKELAAQKQTWDFLANAQEHATFTHHYFGELPGMPSILEGKFPQRLDAWYRLANGLKLGDEALNRQDRKLRLVV